MEDNKALLEDLMSLSIKGAKKELQRPIERGEINPTILVQVTAMLKPHEVKADIRDKKDLRGSTICGRIKKHKVGGGITALRSVKTIQIYTLICQKSLR